MTSESPQPETHDVQDTQSLQTILAENQVQVDDTAGDTDSAYNESLDSASYLSSISSSIFNYKYENGRRYHAFREGEYLMPNDEEEQDRMDLTHHLYRLVLRGDLHLAPIPKDVQRVLDLGTGTGIWALDFADEYPSAHVIGTDLSAIQPKWVPPNCVFEVDDFEDEWLYKRLFDYIHGRELQGCIANEGLLFQRAFKHLAPGGWFEIQSAYGYYASDDDSRRRAPNAMLWEKNIIEGFNKFGKSVQSAATWKEKLTKAGFVDVQQDVRKFPIGAWPKDPHLKEIGRYQVVQQVQAIDSYTTGLFTRVLGWGWEETEVLKAKVKNEIRDPSVHLYIPIYFVWGRKPVD